MNKLIEKLAKQSGHMMPIEINGVPCLHYYADGIDWVNIESLMEKFAELILKECLDLFEDAKVQQEDDVDYGLEEAKSIIKEHFGVK